MISINEQVKYWTDGAERDYATMQVLLEKMLKAFVALETKEQPPITHNLVLLEKCPMCALKKISKIILWL